MIVFDVNVLSYLHGFKLLDKLEKVLGMLGGGRIPWNVYLENKRSGFLGDFIDGLQGDGLVEVDRIKRLSDVGRTVGKIMGSRNSALVGRNVADVQCVALGIHLENCVVFTCDVGVQKLCRKRGVPFVDMMDILSLFYCEDIVAKEVLENKLETWLSPDAGHGRPPDFHDSFGRTFRARYGGEGCVFVVQKFGISPPFHPPIPSIPTSPFLTRVDRSGVRREMWG